MEKREDEFVEFKSTTTQLKEGVISISSMLNKHGECKVYFGVRNDGSVCGQEIGKNTTASISNEIRNHLKPMPYISIETGKEEGKDIICVKASGEDTPYSAYGRYYIRIDDSDVMMEPNQLWEFFRKKEMTYQKWEEKSSHKGIEYVNEEQIIEYMRVANDTGRLNYIYKSVPDTLNKLNLICQDGTLNNAGYYLFGNDGPVLLKEVVYPTDDRRTFSDIKQFHGNIIECINEGIKYIQNNIHYRAQITGTVRKSVPEIPIRAIREMVVNSFAHCHYTNGDSNEITISPSIVRLYNPGGIVRGISPEEFANGNIGSKIRNPLIASALYKNGYIDQFGTGFDRTFRECAENGVSYNYNNDDFGFTFMFRRSATGNVQELSEVNGDSKMDDIDFKILNYISSASTITIAELASANGVSVATINRHIKALIDSNKIQRNGSRRNGSWEIIG